MTVPSDLFSVRDRAATIVAEAAELALAYLHRGVTGEEKNPQDLVSEADRGVEAFIVEQLTAAFPDDVIIGEEGTGRGVDPTGLRRWYVDPIDGTTNYLKGLPNWGVSLGLADPNDELLIGIVAMPMVGEFYDAIHGHGARRDGVPLTSSRETRLDRALVAYSITGAAGPDWGPMGQLTNAVARLGSATLGTRMHGCSVTDLTALASGRVDACVAAGMAKWDVAAGLLIAREAGVRIQTPDGAASVGPDCAFLAAPPALIDEFRSILQPAAE